jgi:hypothetical protein
VSYAPQMIDTRPARRAAPDQLAACIEACFDCTAAVCGVDMLQLLEACAGVCRRCEQACRDLVASTAA